MTFDKLVFQNASGEAYLGGLKKGVTIGQEGKQVGRGGPDEEWHCNCM